MSEFPRWVFEAGFLVYVVVISGVVLLERRRPTATWAILLSLVFLPVLGLAGYLLLSRGRVRKRRTARARRMVDALEGTRALARVQELPQTLPIASQGLVRLAIRGGAAPLRRADAVDLLPSPKEALEAIRSAISGAAQSIHLEFYIWRDDATGRAITALLTEQARRGVAVRVLYDHVGSWGLPTSHFADLRAAGGRTAVFGRLRFGIRRGARLNFRNHRKLVTVDGTVGFLGGLNIGDEYLGDREEGRWRDLFVRIRGDATLGLDATFLDDWLVTTGEVVDLEGHRPRESIGVDARRPPKMRPWQVRRSSAARLEGANPFAPLPARPVASKGPLVQVIPSGPDLPQGSVLSEQFSASIASATRRAFIATPYFIPDEPLMLILRTASMRGVDVRILVPALRHNDSRIVGLAARSYYDELLETGCRIFEYDTRMLHAKYLIADDVAAIGSANMDVRSFHLNYEITGLFYDAEVTEALARVFQHDLRDATEIRAEDRLRLGIAARLGEGFVRILSPLL